MSYLGVNVGDAFSFLGVVTLVDVVVAVEVLSDDIGDDASAEGG